MLKFVLVTAGFYNGPTFRRVWHARASGGYPLPFLTVPVGAEILCGAPECLYKSFSALTREGASN